MSEINNKQKYYLSRFLEETYNLPIESVSKHINEEYDVPENIQDLEFVKNRSIHARSETVHRYNPEFIAKSEYLNEYIKFHLGSVPGTKEGYIKQLDVPEENRFKVRENPNLVFGAYMKDEDIENLNSEILSTVGDLSSYNEDINNDRLQDVLKLCYALFRYSINEGSTADIKSYSLALYSVSSTESYSVQLCQNAEEQYVRRY